MTIYKTYYRKDEKSEWKLAHVNKHHVTAARSEASLKKQGLLVKTETEKFPVHHSVI